MRKTLNTILSLALALGLASAAVAQTATETVVRRSATVIAKYNGKVVVRADDGTVTEFTPTPGKTIMVDGVATASSALKVGTVLSADVVQTEKMVPVKVTEIRNGRLAKVSGNTLVVQAADGTYKTHTIPGDFRFLVEGKEVAVQDLRPGMSLTATIVTTSTKTTSSTEIKNIEGKAPAAAAATAPAPAAAAPAPAPQVSSNAAPAPSPAPAQASEPPAMKHLPKTASTLPLAGLAGVLFLFAGLGFRFFRVR